MKVVVHWLEWEIALWGNNLSVYMVFFRFFEKNPSGRILNRFSADVIAVDQVSVFLSSDFFNVNLIILLMVSITD